MKEPLVYILILLFNSKRWLKENMDSLHKTNYQDYKILIVDNNSLDGGADFIKEKYPEVEIILNKKNYGYGEGNNVGIRYALSKGAQYVVFLNPDTKVHPLWLKELVQVSLDFAGGVTVPMIYDYNGKNINQNFLNCLGNNNFSELRFLEVKHIIGAAFCVRRDVFERVGSFDPFYFLYYDESDFIRRVNSYQFKVVVATRAIIYHHSSVVHKENMPFKIRYYYLRNELIYYYKNPNFHILQNIKDYWVMKYNQAIGKQGVFRGVLSFMKLMIIQFHTIVFIPLIVIKRKREGSKPCYLMTGN